MPLKQKSKHIVTSARGRKIDFEALKRSNETVRAVGNVPVNARGDEIGPNGKIIKKREEISMDPNSGIFLRKTYPLVWCSSCVYRNDSLRRAHRRHKVTPQRTMCPRSAC